ncbi:MAG TPA: fructose-1,6-bisphosphatase [Thermoplasmatales archaeon]|nr:fructose-1,6-bisphosphatase [Thermoplasmatales archaeon]
MDEEIKTLCRTIVEEIRRVVLKKQSAGFATLGKNIGVGADGTPTKHIDKVAEDVVIKHLKKSPVPLNLLSEEAGFIDFGGEYTLILDPIDGTRNAVRGIPFYATSLAVGKNTLNSVEYGLVVNIPTGDIYVAEKNQGSFLNNHRICAPQHTSGKLLSSIVLGESGDKRLRLLPYKENVRSFGAASLEMCFVAHGAVDCFMCLKKHLRVTDIAAATLIVREANGVVKDRQGNFLDMPCDILEHTTVVAGINDEVIYRLLG